MLEEDLIDMADELIKRARAASSLDELEAMRASIVDELRDLYETGTQDGWAEGHEDGVDEGEFVGYDRGREEGYDDGYSEGYEEGRLDGTVWPPIVTGD